MSNAEAIRAFEHAGWQKAAEHYEQAFATATRQFIAPLLDAARVAAGQDVLDVASGPGFVTAGAADRGARARGLDFSDAMLGVARRLHPAITFDQGDAEALPYADASFDAVVSNFGIHHVPSPAAALRQALRVLRPGGWLAFSIWATPTENIPWKLVQDAVARCGDPGASKAPAPGGGLTPVNAAAVLEQAGFTDTATERVGRVWQHADGASLLRALGSGTARMAGLIAAQPADTTPAIIAEIDRSAEPYRTESGLALPLVAYVTAGRKA
jgi:SAM-dependent methyltransferase